MDGAVQTFKVVLWRRAYTQTPGIDYEKTFLTCCKTLGAFEGIASVAHSAYYVRDLWQLDRQKDMHSQWISSSEERMRSGSICSAVGLIMYAVRCTRPAVLRDLNVELRVSCYTLMMDICRMLMTQVSDWDMNASFIAAFDASKEAVWVRKFISGLSVVPTIENPLTCIVIILELNPLANVVWNIKVLDISVPKFHYASRYISGVKLHFADVALLFEFDTRSLARPLPRELVNPVTVTSKGSKGQGSSLFLDENEQVKVITHYAESKRIIMERQKKVSFDLTAGSSRRHSHSDVLDSMKSRYPCIYQPVNPTADVAIPKDEEEEYNEDRRFLIPLYVFGARDIYGPDSPLPPSMSSFHFLSSLKYEYVCNMICKLIVVRSIPISNFRILSVLDGLTLEFLLHSQAINAALTLLRHLALRCLPRWSDPSVNRWEQVKLNYLEQPLPPAHVASAGQQFAPQILAAHTAWVKGSKEIDGLMLMIMEPEIQRNLGKSPC
ncbi:hypothetical protein Tco_0511716 [Tanacetum coccineum]